MSEKNLQKSVFEFCVLNKIRMHHYANERKCSSIYGKQLKLMGVRKGVADCHFPKGNSIFKDMWIELKVPPNKPNTDQIEFLEEMISYGSAGYTAYSIDEAMNIIKSFYSIR